jgi:threonine dehydratase
MQRLVSDIVTLSDEQLLAQMRFFATRMKIIVEPTGCLAAAAVLNKKVPVAGARVGVVVSGGNADPALLCESLGAASAAQ